jgi:thymidylate kinase
MYPDKPRANLDHDLLGTKEKAEAIKNFIEVKEEYLKENNMIVLYGNWGSGKSSVINHIMDRLDKNRNICLKFDAWLYERDDNLPYSLLEFIIDNLLEYDKFKENTEITKKAENALKLGSYILSGLTKGIKFNIKTPQGLVSLLGIVPEITFEYDMEKVVHHFENNGNDNDNVENKSYHQKVEDLKKYFKDLSKVLEHNNQRLIVFIDELDRCEPEHILNLLASIKVLFAYGENIIYFVAVDKDAVSKAIKTKYGDVVKAEEYLEKIFNISFNMPRILCLKKFIMQYDFFNDEVIAEKLTKFFEEIKFTNPRHLKKVLNKYAILTEFKRSNIDKGLIPKIIRYDENDGIVGYLFDTIFVLYFIILYDIYPKKYLEVKRYEYRVRHLKHISLVYSGGYKRSSRPYFNKYIDAISNNLLNTAKFLEIKKHLSDKDDFIENVIRFGDLMAILKEVGDENYTDFDKFISEIPIFLSCIGDENIDNETNLAERYSKAGITVNFWIYIKNHYEDLKEKNYSNPYPFTSLFKMAETLL